MVLRIGQQQVEFLFIGIAVAIGVFLAIGGSVPVRIRIEGVETEGHFVGVEDSVIVVIGVRYVRIAVSVVVGKRHARFDAVDRGLDIRFLRDGERSPERGLGAVADFPQRETNRVVDQVENDDPASLIEIEEAWIGSVRVTAIVAIREANIVNAIGRKIDPSVLKTVVGPQRLDA